MPPHLGARGWLARPSWGEFAGRGGFHGLFTCRRDGSAEKSQKSEVRSQKFRKRAQHAPLRAAGASGWSAGLVPSLNGGPAGPAVFAGLGFLTPVVWRRGGEAGRRPGGSRRKPWARGKCHVWAAGQSGGAGTRGAKMPLAAARALTESLAHASGSVGGHARAAQKLPMAPSSRSAGPGLRRGCGVGGVGGER